VAILPQWITVPTSRLLSSSLRLFQKSGSILEILRLSEITPIAVFLSAGLVRIILEKVTSLVVVSSVANSWLLLIDAQIAPGLIKLAVSD